MSNLLGHTEALIRGLRQETHPAGLTDDRVDQHPQDDGPPPTDLSPPTLNDSRQEGDSPLLELFLADSTLPAAVFHSHALDRDFILARDEAALEALIEADHALPVLFFAEAEKLRRLGLTGLGALLDFRAEFGPGVRLVKVTSGDG